MIVRKFVVEQHEEYGELGFRPAWMPDGDPLGSMTAAHDILEHTRSDRCEWPALGAAYYIRGEQGYFSRRVGNSDPVENLAADFGEQYGYAIQRSFEEILPDPGRTTPLGDDVEAVFHQVIQKGIKHILEEESCSCPGYDVRVEDNGIHEDDCDKLPWLTDEAQRRILGWFRIGYRKARRRYPDAASACYTFEEITRAFDGLDMDEANGHTVVAHVDPRRMHVTVDIEYGY